MSGSTRRVIRDRLPSRPVLTYYAYVLSRSAAFTVPIYVLFYQSRGLSLAQFGILEATYTVAVLGFEFPTGYLADRVGRRNGLAASNVLGAVGAVGYAVSHSFPAFLLAVVVRALGATFESGTADAWLYEVLAEAGSEDEFARVAGRARALGLAGQSGATVLGSLAYEANHLLPWVLDAGALLAGTALLLVAVPDDAPDEGGEHLTPGAAVAVARTTLGRPGLRGFVAYTSLFLGVVGAALLFVQPVSVDVAGVDPGDLGFLYAGLTLVSATAASQTGRVKALVGVEGWFRLAPPVAAAGLLAVGLAPWLAVPLFLLLGGLAATSRPLADGYVNDGVRSRGRATVLSTVSMLRSVAVAPLKVAAGAAAVAALPGMLAGLGGALLAGSALLAAGARPFDGVDAEGRPL